MTNPNYDISVAGVAHGGRVETAEVVSFRSRMSEAEYERERASLRTLYGNSSTEAVAKRDQAMADLFIRSGWTQEELAAKEGKDQAWVTRRLRFGRFLNFMPNGINAENLPDGLTEGRFRGFWEQTKGEINERVRFRMVHDLLAEQASLKRRPAIGKQLVDTYADGKWHAPRTMAAQLGLDLDHVESTLNTMKALRGTYGCKAERKKVGRVWHYRIFKAEKKVSSAELAEKLAPIIDGLMIEGKKNPATASPPAVLILAHQLKRLVDEWSE